MEKDVLTKRQLFVIINFMKNLYAGVAELADAQDLKSCDGNIVPVRFRSPAPTEATPLFEHFYRKAEFVM